MSGAPFTRSQGEHVPHALHGTDRHFRETNCYIDLMVELLHALDLDPLACLGFTLAVDFEGDQWTFGKPSHGDLERLYGLRIDELGLHRPLLDHCSVQVERGRVPLVEVDSFFLPDTAGTDYRQQHVKTTIAIVGIDREVRRLRYFHNAAYAELSGEDFEGVFRPASSRRPEYLPPYCEIVKLDRVVSRSEVALRALAFELARRHFAQRPTENPVRAHAARIEDDVARIATSGFAYYHAYVFAGLRQLGASCELGASHLRFLDRSEPCLRASTELENIAATSKTLIMKLARVASSRKQVDLTESFAEMADAWDRATNALSDVLAT